MIKTTELIGPLEEGSFVARDFSALADFELSKRTSSAIAALNDTDLIQNLDR
jgi:hypothetical protein